MRQREDFAAPARPITYAERSPMSKMLGFSQPSDLNLLQASQQPGWLAWRRRQQIKLELRVLRS